MDFLQITTTGWVAISISLSMLLLAGFLFSLGTERFHYLWGVFCVAVAVWAGGMYMVTLTNDPDVARFWWKISFVGLILNPFLFYHFVVELLENKFYLKHKVFISLGLYLTAFIFLYLNLTTNLFIDNVTFLFGELYYNTPPGDLHPYFTAFFIATIVYSLYLVMRAYTTQERDVSFRRRAIYLFVAALIAYIGGSMNFLIAYGIEVPPATNFTVAFGSAFIAYSILRYRLFNVRVVTAQFLAFIIITFALFRLALSISSQEIVFNTVMLFVTLAIGLYLVLSVRNEVEQREQIQVLASELKIKNEKLTELDKLKSQFLSFATHELKAPLTAARNSISLMLDGSYGKVAPAAEEAGRQVFDRVTDMVKLVDNYLNVSHIEQGKISYDFADVDLTELVARDVEAMQVSATKDGLTLSLTVASGAKNLMAKIDAGRITEVISNLIDNSIKYTPTGSIALTLERVGGKARLTIKDTGGGMTENTMKNLFKLFSPGEDSRKINPASTGVGLYISRAHVLAHKGTLTASSDGKDKGSQFVMELPLL